MGRSGRQKPPGTVYSEEQIRRSITAAGLRIENEVDSDGIVFCPYHNNYRSPAGEVSKESGMFWCFSCHQSKTLPQLIMHLTNKTFFQAVRLIDRKATESDIAQVIEAAMEEKPTFVPFDELLIKRLSRQALDSPRAIEYFRSRRVTKDSVQRYLLGYSEKQDMITIPVMSTDGSMFVGFVGRSIEGKVFKNTPNMPKSKTMFNLNNARFRNEVFVVESALDAIRIEQQGRTAVATLGSTISKSQLDLLRKNFTNVILIADNDEAGHKMVSRAVETLGSLVIPVFPSEGYKDVGSMDNTTLDAFLRGLDDPLAQMLQ